MGKLRLLAWLLATGASAWWLGTDMAWPDAPEAQAMAVVRAVAAALAAYLFVVSVLAIRLPRLAPRFVRRLVAGAVGTALLAAPVTASAAPTVDERPPVTADAPVLRRVEPEAPPPAAFSEGPHPNVGGKPAENAETVVLDPGDHLWGVAEAEVGRRLGRAPTDAEVVPYWTALVRQNAGRLQSGDPDLVFPGETIALPS